MARKISNRQAIAILAGSVVLSLGVGAGVRLLTSPQPAEISEENSQEVATAVPPIPEGELFADGAFVPASRELRLASPDLLQSTPKDDRLAVVLPSVGGRPNPFTPLVTAKPAPKPEPAPAAAAIAPAPPAANPQPLPVVPVTATQSLPPLPPMAPAPSAVLPQPSVATAPSSLPPTPVPVSPVDRVEITGVAQIGDRTSVIIREIGLSTSRYVREGDLVAGGQVRVKRIDMSSTEPVVILEFNGQEFYRTVGSGALVGML